MTPAIYMLGFFCFGLTLVALFGPTTSYLLEWIARLMFVFTVAPGLFFTIQAARRTWRTIHAPVDPERYQAKRVALTICLLAPLLYSILLDAFGMPLYGVFLWDYIFVLPALLVVLPSYIRWSDPRLPEPEDGYASFGRVILGKRPWSWGTHKPLVLAWAVKTLFIPVMYGGLQLMLIELLLYRPSLNPSTLVAWLFTFGLTFDILIATIGYLCTSRLLATDVRSTDSTWSGWLVCMICYPPLWVVMKAIREQADNVTWDNWLSPDQPIYWLWATLIVSSWMIYWLSTASFGVRFSNLTYRGLIDHGPYRFTKHPAYWGKNIYWWLHTVPFVGVGTAVDFAQNFLGLGFVSLIYYLRAKTEERHLSKFPEYRAYGEWIAVNGLWARCQRLLGTRAG